MIPSNYEKIEMFKKGIFKGIPVLIGFIPISTAFAVIALQSGLTSYETILMSIMLLAGASQLMAVNMLVLGAGSVEIIIATLIINIRHLIMSTYLMNRFKKIPQSLKIILAFGVTDETFGIMSMEEDEKCNQYFFAGLVGMTYGSWVVGTIVGTLLSKIIPSNICMSMSIALYAMFIAILMPSILDNFKVGLVICISILLNTIFSMFLKPSWSIVFATIIGGLIGSMILRKGNIDDNKHGNAIDDFRNVNSNLHT